MKVNHALPSANILGPRYRCWRCKGRRRVPNPSSRAGATMPCPSCHKTDPYGSRSHQEAELTLATAALERAA